MSRFLIKSVVAYMDWLLYFFIILKEKLTPKIQMLPFTRNIDASVGQLLDQKRQL